MKNVAFTPWTGKYYFENGYNNIKILVMGESHYCENCDECDDYKKCGITTTVIESYLKYKNGNGQHKSWMTTFTRFTNIFFGKHCDTEEINIFWNSVLFYNYVQKSTGGTRQSPTEQMFKDSKMAFNEILNEYEPDIIIVWGKRLWSYLDLDNGYWGEEYILDEHGRKFYYFKCKTKNIPAYWIYHPSTSYLTYKHSKYLKRAMELV